MKELRHVKMVSRSDKSALVKKAIVFFVLILKPRKLVKTNSIPSKVSSIFSAGLIRSTMVERILTYEIPNHDT